MKKINKIRDYLIKHRTDEYGNLDLSDLDFKDFNGDILLNGMVAKKKISNLGQNASIISNTYQEAETIWNSWQDADIICNHNQTADSIDNNNQELEHRHDDWRQMMQ